MAVALTESQLPALLELLALDLPRSFRVHGELKNHLLGLWPGMSYWVDAWPLPRVVFSKPVPGCTKSGFVDNIFSLHCQDRAALASLLHHPGLVDWSLEPVFAAVTEEYTDVVEAAGKEAGYLVERDDSYLYTASPDSLQTYQAPPGLQLTSLGAGQVEEVARRWRHSGPGVQSYLQALLAFPSRCLLDPATGQLVGSVQGQQYGTAGMLVVQEAWRGRGLGSLLLTELARLYPQPPPSLTDVTNLPAQRLHLKVGYSRVPGLQVSWIKFSKAASA